MTTTPTTLSANGTREQYDWTCTHSSLRDWLVGTLRYDIWLTLAGYDILLRYRRSLLGPLWLTISMAALIAGMGPLYSALFNIPLSTFFPHLTLGFIFWNFFSCSIGDGCYTFISAAPYLKQAPYNRSIFTWRTLSRNFLILLHHMILFVPIALWAGISLSIEMLLFIPGLFITMLNLLGVITTVGFLSARFRDVPQIVSSILQLLMFMTPVFWLPESLPDRSKVIMLNPFASFLSALRSPLLGQVTSLRDWGIIGVSTLVNLACAITIYRVCRNRVVYWL